MGSLVIVDQDDTQTFDVYGRIVGKVTCSGKVLNSELLYNGYATILTEYCRKSEFFQEAWATKYGCGHQTQSPTTNTVLSAPSQTNENNCDPSYPDVCIASPPPDLDCGDIPYKKFRVLPPDPHKFDGDKDGIGCES